MGCDGQGKATFTQTIYPEAEGGSQVLTPEGTTWCFGLDMPAGYWAASSDLEAILTAHGIPVASSQEVKATPDPVAAVTAPNDGAGTAGWVGVALGVLVV